ncbi:MAG: glycosyltransferase family 2 protein [Brevundimonas sp.]
MESLNRVPPLGGPVIVTTLRNAGALLDDFIAWHRAVGFSRLYLVFDDPADPDRLRVAGQPGVEVIACDEVWRSRWRESPLFADIGASVVEEVMARQLLNASVVADIARSAGFDWLLHIDVDELFHPPGGDARALFDALQDRPVDVIAFPNMEAVPEREAVARPFAEVTLFKVPVERMGRIVSGNPTLADALRRSERFGAGFFNLYSNGKSAVRLDVPGLQPFGVHDFDRPDGSARRVRATDAVVLHYACCGLGSFTAKYQLLGRFADRWWNRYDIAAAIGPFHLQARDVVMGGDARAIADFYRDRVAITEPGEVRAWEGAGLLCRLPGPSQRLNAP